MRERPTLQSASPVGALPAQQLDCHAFDAIVDAGSIEGHIDRRTGVTAQSGGPNTGSQEEQRLWRHRRTALPPTASVRPLTPRMKKGPLTVKIEVGPANAGAREPDIAKCAYKFGAGGAKESRLAILGWLPLGVGGIAIALPPFTPLAIALEFQSFLLQPDATLGCIRRTPRLNGAGLSCRRRSCGRLIRQPADHQASDRNDDGDRRKHGGQSFSPSGSSRVESDRASPLRRST